MDALWKWWHQCWLFLGWVKQLLQCFLGSRWLGYYSMSELNIPSNTQTFGSCGRLLHICLSLTKNPVQQVWNSERTVFYAFFGFSPLGQSPTFTHLSRWPRWRPDPVQRPSPAKRRHKMNQKWAETFAHLFTSFEANSAIICGQQVCRIIQNSRLLGLQVRLDQFSSIGMVWMAICHDLSHLFCTVLCWMPPWQRYRCLLWISLNVFVQIAALNVLPPCPCFVCPPFVVFLFVSAVLGCVSFALLTNLAISSVVSAVLIRRLLPLEKSTFARSLFVWNLRGIILAVLFAWFAQQPQTWEEYQFLSFLSFSIYGLERNSGIWFASFFNVSWWNIILIHSVEFITCIYYIYIYYLVSYYTKYTGKISIPYDLFNQKD